jgi:hypothetical protein
MHLDRLKELCPSNPDASSCYVIELIVVKSQFRYRRTKAGHKKCCVVSQDLTLSMFRGQGVAGHLVENVESRYGTSPSLMPELSCVLPHYGFKPD